MTKQLSLDDMLECLARIDPDEAAVFRDAMETIGSNMAERIADLLNVETGYASFQGLSHAGTCAPFYPRFDGLRCPKPLDEFDVNEWNATAPTSTREERKAFAKTCSIDLRSLADFQKTAS